MERATTAPPDRTAGTTVACPHCERAVAVPVPDEDADPTVSTRVAAFGDHTVAHCSAGHRFWVYYC
ncbi:hypothetical protein ACFPYI_07020 [Halomarina salina]|uniref:Small CPxCG-related zinc finger protein n=1 Tax=Halomarina salina TaxID=1872699 RepID=A0ABD5RLL4_9EURY|nr:hypothetical protein [Halomarina salina]